MGLKGCHVDLAINFTECKSRLTLSVTARRTRPKSCISGRRELSFRVIGCEERAALERALITGGNRMRASSQIFLLLLCVATSSMSFAMPVPQDPASSGAQEKDRAEIAAAVQKYMDSWNKHDVQAVALTYTEDTDLINNFGSLTHGRAQVVATFGPMLAGVYNETRQTGTIKSIRFLKPDVAAVDVDWEMTGAKNQDGSVRPTRKGLHSLIMIKQSDGSWLIAVMHIHEYTSTAPLAPQPTQPPAR